MSSAVLTEPCQHRQFYLLKRTTCSLHITINSAASKVFVNRSSFTYKKGLREKITDFTVYCHSFIVNKKIVFFINLPS